MKVIAKAKGRGQACVVRDFFELDEFLDFDFLKRIANAKGKAQAESALAAANELQTKCSKNVVEEALSLIANSNSSIQVVEWEEVPSFSSPQYLFDFIEVFEPIDEKVASLVWKTVKMLKDCPLGYGEIVGYAQELAKANVENIEASLEVADKACYYRNVSRDVLNMATAVAKAENDFSCEESAKVAQIPILFQEKNPEEYVSIIASAKEEEGARLSAGVLTLLLKKKEEEIPSLDLAKYKLLLQKIADGSFTGTLMDYLEEKKDYDRDIQKHVQVQNLEDFTCLVSKVKEHDLKVKQLLYKGSKRN